MEAIVVEVIASLSSRTLGHVEDPPLPEALLYLQPVLRARSASDSLTMVVSAYGVTHLRDEVVNC